MGARTFGIVVLVGSVVAFVAVRTVADALVAVGTLIWVVGTVAAGTVVVVVAGTVVVVVGTVAVADTVGTAVLVGSVVALEVVHPDHRTGSSSVVGATSSSWVVVLFHQTIAWGEVLCLAPP